MTHDSLPPVELAALRLARQRLSDAAVELQARDAALRDGTEDLREAEGDSRQVELRQAFSTAAKAWGGLIALTAPPLWWFGPREEGSSLLLVGALLAVPAATFCFSIAGAVLTVRHLLRLASPTLDEPGAYEVRRRVSALRKEQKVASSRVREAQQQVAVAQAAVARSSGAGHLTVWDGEAGNLSPADGADLALVDEGALSPAEGPR